MRPQTQSAQGAALLYALTASAALACPTAADLDGGGIRFIGADGADEVHRRLDAERIEIDYVVENQPTSRSILAHGVYIVWYGDIDGAGAIVPGSGGVFARPDKLSTLPMPAPGLEWEGGYMFTDATGSYGESGALTVEAATTWTLGTCALTALPATMVVSGVDGPLYTEEMMYLPDLGTAVLVAVTDTAGPTTYEYVAVRAEAN
ncbi:hypothetical protein A8B78_06725 [Jannaschia sp. EhC01]|nr:hypothetical protein A8B78_06725 [Jannaschia sp. EhC01]